MGRDLFSRDAYTASFAERVPDKGPATARAEQHAHSTGKLNPLVDPSGYGVIRRSLPRFEEQEDGRFLMLVGTPMPLETRVDTTGSMGNNVDIALRVLPDLYDLCSGMLPGYDLQIATGIFGDVVDRFVLCRPQFEMVPDKIVEQLTLMVPERGGGDEPEDPHYGLFGAAYLTAPYINRVGLKGYDFTVSDASARDRLDIGQLTRIFGDEVMEKATENGYELDQNDLPSTEEVVHDLQTRTHAFFLQVGENSRTNQFWTRVFGANRVVVLPSTQLLPQVQAVIIGLTEETLSLEDAPSFLTANNVSEKDAARIVRSVANIPIGAQAALPDFARRPQKGDIFKEKTDAWPVDHIDIAGESSDDNPDSSAGPSWV